MADIAVGHLLSAIHDVLTLPRPATPKARLAYLELTWDRSAAVRRAVDHARTRAVDHARTTGDLARATDLIDEAIQDLPVAYSAWAPPGVEVPQ